MPPVHPYVRAVIDAAIHMNAPALSAARRMMRVLDEPLPQSVAAHIDRLDRLDCLDKQETAVRDNNSLRSISISNHDNASESNTIGPESERKTELETKLETELKTELETKLESRTEANANEESSQQLRQLVMLMLVASALASDSHADENAVPVVDSFMRSKPVTTGLADGLSEREDEDKEEEDSNIGIDFVDHDNTPLPPPFVGTIRTIRVRDGYPRSIGSAFPVDSKDDDGGDLGFLHPSSTPSSTHPSLPHILDKTGGAILGTGRNNTIVYTLDDLARMNPDIQTACLEVAQGHCIPLPFYESTPTKRKKGIDNEPDKPENLVVKHVYNVFESIREAQRNATVRSLFGKDERLFKLTLLHEKYVAVRLTVMPMIFPSAPVYSMSPSDSDTSVSGTSRAVDKKNNKKNYKNKNKKRILDRNKENGRHLVHSPPGRSLMLPVHRTHLIFRRMLGSLANSQGIVETEHDFYTLTKTVLEFLAHLHKNMYLHIDIKPANIGFYDDGNSSPGGQDDISRRFAVGDYGLLTTMEHVAQRLTRTGSYQAGTRGYISPLLLPTKHDIGNKRTYSKFATVANLCRLFPGDKRDSASFWEAYFARNRRQVMNDIAQLGKVDLHSLAITLFDLIPIERRSEWLSRSDGIIPRLMFFRSTDFMFASDALRELKRTRSVFGGIKKRGSVARK